jgi:flagellar FliL protein
MFFVGTVLAPQWTMSESTPPADSPDTKKKGSKLGLFAVVGILVVGGGGGAFWWLHRATPVEAAEAKPKPKHAAERGIVSFEPFVVNLADPSASRFLRASVQVVLSSPEAAERIQKKPVELMQLRSAILDLLTVQTSDRLVTAEGKTALKKSIAEHLSPLVEGAEVLDVLFSDFVIQF